MLHLQCPTCAHFWSMDTRPGAVAAPPPEHKPRPPAGDTVELCGR
ncbi:hypothetical protein I553_6143 [Mycobacterium xenopi 4042]|uniref:Uncharacterized protein n=1 Tax=Mycobacterium xenopi 4042 TaxID=1299334 RepID=X8BGG4_MYCXE|nr:hypothetical protein I553_6143 [Mycobacterium xenopi 4042]